LLGLITDFLAIPMTTSVPTTINAAAQAREIDTRLTPELQLLLTCARLELTDAQKQRLTRLCGEIVDWSSLMNLAHHHLMLPLAYRHLRSLAPEVIPAPALATMRSLCQRRVIEIMTMAAEQQRLVTQVLQPLGIPYVLFKGPSLALRYYGQLGLRQARDVDMLIAPSHLLALSKTLLERGYRLDPGHLTERYDQGLTPDDLGAACRYLNVVTLISPNGVRLELHRLIDSHGYIFRTDDLLAKAENFDINGSPCQMLPTSELFVYICYHHSRHQWSRLHWLADLDAFQRHASFDLQAIQDVANQWGLWPTVASALALHQACSEAMPESAELYSAQAHSMRDACLQMLAAGPENEVRLMQNRPTPDFNFSWQIRFWYLCYLTFLHVHPTYADYKAWPLPLSMHSIYYVARPVRLIWRQFSSRIEKLARQ
jgi:hypothetical protein